MMFFKWAFVRQSLRSVFTMLVLSILVSACVKPQNRNSAGIGEDGENEMSSATFYVESFEGTSQDGEMMKGFSIPLSRVYSFSACLKTSRARAREALIGHKFAILGGAGEIPVTTDGKGCANWSETIAFNYISDEKYLTLTRKIRATGVHKGAREIKFVINPWNLDTHSEKAIEFKKAGVLSEYLVTEAAAKNLLEGKSEAGASITRPLWLDKLEIEVAPASGKDQSSLDRKLVFTFKPSIMMKDYRGTESPVALKEANLSFKATLTTASDGKIYALYSSSKALPVTRDGDIFRVESEPQPVYNVSQKRLKLVVRAEPVNGPAGLMPYEALYEITGSDLSSYGTVKPVFVSRTEQGPVAGGQTLVAQTNAAERLDATGVSPSGITRAKRFILSPVSSLSVTPVEETTTERKIMFSGKVCIVDTTTKEPATDMNFTVVKASGEEETLPTKNDNAQKGCLIWTHDSVTHKIFESEHYLIRDITIRHAATGFEETIKIAINPWDTFPARFLLNMKDEAKHVNEVNARPPQPSRLLFKTYSFNTEGTREYEVDQYLRPTATKHFEFKLEALVSRPSSVFMGQAAVPEILRRGKYLFRATSYVQYKDRFGEMVEVVTSMAGKNLRVDVDNGTALVQADFKVKDPRAWSARSTIFFELLPLDEKKMREAHAENLIGGEALEQFVDENSGLETPTYAAAFWVGDETGGPIVIATDKMRVHADEDLDSDEKIIDMRVSDEKIKLSDVKKLYQGLKVADIEARKAALEAEIVRQVEAAARLEKILEIGNLDYVPLANEGAIFAQNPKLASNNQLLPKTNAAKKLIDVLNGPLLRSARRGTLGLRSTGPVETVTVQTLKDIVEGRKDLDLPLAERLCSFYFEELIPSQIPSLGKEYDAGAWARGCVARAQSDLKSVFTVDRKLRVFEVDKKAESLGALNMSFLLGTDVSFVSNSSLQYSGSFGVSPAKIAEEIAKSAATALSQLWAPLRVVSYLSAIGLRGDLTGTTGESTMVSEGSRLTTGIPMTRLKDRIGITVKRSESCAAIRLNPTFWERNDRVAQSFLSVAGKTSRVLQVMTRGLFLCSGVQNMEPKRIVENYYTIDQDLRIDGKFDHGNLKNHPWLIAIRGENDYVNFMKFVAARKTSASEVPSNLPVEEYSVDRMENAYQAYRGYTPNMPGLYTIRTKLVDPETEQGKSNFKAWWQKHSPF